MKQKDTGEVELVLQNIQRGEALLRSYAQKVLDITCKDEDEDEDEDANRGEMTPSTYSFRQLRPGETVYTGGTGETYDYTFMVSRQERLRKETVIHVIHEIGIHQPEDSIGAALNWVESTLGLRSAGREPSNDQILSILNLLVNAPNDGPDTWVKTKDVKLRLELAGNPLMPPAALGKLAEQKSAAVRMAVADNSAAPKELRRKLLHELLTAEEPNVRARVAAGPYTDVQDLRKLSKDEAGEVLFALLSNKKTPDDLKPELYERLVTSGDAALFLKLAKSGNTPLAVFPRFLTCNDEQVMIELARKKSLPDSLRAAAIQKLVESKSSEAMLELAENKLTPPEVLTALSNIENIKVEDDDPEYPTYRTLHLFLAMNPSTSPKTLLSIMKSEDENEDPPFLRHGVACNPSTSPEALEILGKHKIWGVRQRVSEHVSTPDELLMLLAKDKELGVRKSLAKRKTLPDAALEILSKDKSSEVRMWVAISSKTPIEILSVLAKDKSPYVREAVEAHPSLPIEAIKYFEDREQRALWGDLA